METSGLFASVVIFEGKELGVWNRFLLCDRLLVGHFDFEAEGLDHAQNSGPGWLGVVR